MVFFYSEFSIPKELSIEELEEKSLNIDVINTAQLNDLMGIKPELEKEEIVLKPKEKAPKPKEKAPKPKEKAPKPKEKAPKPK
ncbi:MAG: hypothetical protein HOD92_18200, partial [Deltaproteobacteria bacterium]|nr:hypothetical protein [Deltaproteobacteria bacterium]